MIPRQGEQRPVVIISYMGYSPPKCTCHGKQAHSSKYMILLECLHAQSHVSSPQRLPHTCLSQMRVKLQFSKQKLFVLENTLPSFGKYIGLPSEANCWIFLQNSHGSTSEMTVGQLFKAILRKIFLEIPFTIIFIFLSFLMSCTLTYRSRVSRCIWNALCQFQTIDANIFLHAYINIINSHNLCYSIDNQ